MQIAAITKPGLITIATLVAALWGCLIAERLTLRNADREMGSVLQQLRQVNAHQPQPAKLHRKGRLV